MSSNPQNPFLSSLLAYLKPSHRTLPEQIVGLFIFILFSLSVLFFNDWILNASLSATKNPWNLKNWWTLSAWGVYHLLFAISMWTLWRRISLLKLKIELSLFITQFLLQVLFFFCFFILEQNLLSLFVNLFLVSNSLLCILLFYKKKKISASLLIPCFMWIFYLLGASMSLCILNP